MIEFLSNNPLITGFVLAGIFTAIREIYKK